MNFLYKSPNTISNKYSIGVKYMAMHLIEVKTLHGYTINELNEIINSSKSKYTKCLLSAVIVSITEFILMIL